MSSTAPKRRAVAAGTAVSLALSLIGGTVVLLFGDRDAAPNVAALKPVEAPISSTPEPEALTESESEPDLSMFGLGGTSSGSSLADGQTPLPTSADSTDMSAGAFLPSAPASLPSGPLFPPGPVVDWGSLVDPLVASQINAQATNLTGSILGTSVGAVAATMNSASVIIGDLILYAAYTNNGQGLLNQAGTALAAVPAAAAAAGVQLPPPPDLTGLTAAFAAAAAAPPAIGVPALPGLPQLPQLPPPPAGLPTPEQVVTGLALGAAALPALPALPSLFAPPQLPPPPDLSFLLLPLLLPPPPPIGIPLFAPPSITRMLGLPF